MATPQQTLGLRSDASEAEIRAAYRRLVLLRHPDRCDEPQAPTWFHAITMAYKSLMAGIARPEVEKAATNRPRGRGSPGPDDIHLIVRLSPTGLRNGGHRRIRFTRFDTCPACGGARRLSFCTACRGQSRIWAQVTISVSFPVDLKDGSVLRLRGAGNVGEEGHRGDVWVKMLIAKHG